MPVLRRRGYRGSFRAPLVLGAFLLVFLALPVILLIPRIEGNLLAEAWSREATWRAVLVSVASSSAATALAALFGVPLGYALARAESPWRAVVRGLVVLPLVLPPVVGGVLLLLVFGPGGTLGSLVTPLGEALVNSLAAVVLAQLFVAAPFVVLTSEAAFRALDRRYEEAGAGLGLAPSAVFRRVSLPMSRGVILAGLGLAWMRCMGEFGATAVMAYYPRTLTTETWVAVTGRGVAAALPLAALSLLITTVAVAGAHFLGRRHLAPAASRTATSVRRAGSLPESLADRPRDRHRQGLRSRVEVRLGSFSLRAELDVRDEAVALLGPSGAGKTTLLRCLAGFQAPDAGRVTLDGRVLFNGGADSSVSVPPHDRGVVMLPQETALLSHLTVEDNLLLGVLEPGERERRRALEVLSACGLGHAADRHPDELSGGERQRVALARGLLVSPGLLLLDEPFASLDAPVRERLQEDLVDLRRRYGIPLVHVTHDLREALAVGDRLALLVDGRLIQIGSRAEVCSRPADLAAARLVGYRNFLPGRAVGRAEGALLVRSSSLLLWVRDSGARLGCPVSVCFRDEDVGLAPPNGMTQGFGLQGAGRQVVDGRVITVEERGTHARVTVAVGSDQDRLLLTASRRIGGMEEWLLAPGDAVTVELPVEAGWPVPAEGEPFDGYGLPQAALAPPVRLGEAAPPPR